MSGLYNSVSLLVGQNQASKTPPACVTSVTDGTAQRLQVEASPSGGTLAAQEPWGTVPGAQTIWLPCTNSGSANLLVNGTAAAPVVFAVPAQAKQIVATMLKVVLSASNVSFTGNQITNTAGLLGIGQSTRALPNGLLFNTVSAGVTTTLAKVQIHEDFFGFNGEQNFVTGSTNYVLTTTLLFTQPLVAGSTTDAVQVVVQDQMTAATNLLYLRAFVGGTRAA